MLPTHRMHRSTPLPTHPRFSARPQASAAVRLLAAAGAFALAVGASAGPEVRSELYEFSGAPVHGPIVSGLDLTDVRHPFDVFAPSAADGAFGPLNSISSSMATRFDGGGGDPAAMVNPFAASNMQLLSWIPLNNFAGGQTAGNDCWGYVSPSGREYAIMGLEAGFGFVEVTDPYNPVVIETISGPSSPWHDVKVIGEYAYGVSEGGSGIQVMDLRQIDSGVVTLVRNRQQFGHSSTHNIVANEDSGFVYLTGANIANGGLVAVDVTSNPELPNIVGSWDSFYVHDAQIVSYTSGPYAGREIAFALSGTGNGSGSTALRIVDVTDKSNMFLISTISWSGARYAHQGWLSEDRSVLYVNDELDEGDSVGQTTTRLFDVSDINNPSFIGIATSGRPATDHNLYVHDGFMYQSNYRSGLRVFDVSDQENPNEVAWFDTSPGSDSAGFSGAWSNYPFLPSGTIIVSDIERGLFLVRLTVNRLDIDLVGGEPGVLMPADQSTIGVSITEVGLSLDASSVTMVVNDEAGERRLPGAAVGGGEFEFTFDDLQCFDTVDYFFEAEATDGSLWRLPPAGGTAPFSALVATDQQQVFADSFNTNQGWGVTNSGGLTDGAWTRGQPVGGGDRGDPATDFDGNGWAYLTDNDDGNSDVDGGTTTLTSPAFNLAGATRAVARYAVWYSNSFGNAPNSDTMTVEVSNNNGQTWTALQTIGPGSLDAWVEYVMPLDGVIAPTSAMRLRFNASDLGDGSVVEAAVDAVSIERLECEPPANCPGDLADSSGFGAPDEQVDFGDFFALSFLAGPCPGGTPGCTGDLADTSGFGAPDGQIDFGDFFALSFLAGPCP